MKQVFSAEGARALRGAWILLGLSLATSAAIAWGSHWYLERERRERVGAGQRLEQARARAQGAQRELDSLQESAVVFRELVDRGLLAGERRIDLVEMVNGLRARHRLFALDYEIAPQRPLKLPGGRAFAAVEVLASRVQLRMRALHEGDVLDFIAELAASRKGFYPVDRCAMRRLEAEPDALQPRVEAECALEWITLKET